MANPNKLKIKYQPAKKEIRFELYHNENKIPLSSCPKLKNLEKMSGKFFLQTAGNDFIDDLLTPFTAGEVNIEVETTEVNYEDFVELFEDYNANSDRKIIYSKGKVLPDMKTCYEAVKNYGLRASELLLDFNEQLSKIKNIDADICNKFIEGIQQKSQEIKEEIEAFTDNVNICFTGTYSTGKSTLINSLIGAKLFSMADKSETARVYELKSPEKENPESITFTVKDNDFKLLWNKDNNEFCLSSKCSASMTKKVKEKVLDIDKSKTLSEQISLILKNLNEIKDDKDFNIDAKISVEYNIPLDDDIVKFTIYDTPGTDSNCAEHQDILRGILGNQTNTILVFVIGTTTLECSGNSTLLGYLADNEKKAKSKIDLERSFFVVNRVDSANCDLSAFSDNVISHKDHHSIRIELKDKKLFFTNAFAAELANRYSILTKDEKEDLEDAEPRLRRESKGRYYQFDRIGNSSVYTEKLKGAANKELADAGTDDSRIDFVCSGVWSLREELKNYGRKYAPAVKTAAILERINSLMKSVETELESLNSVNVAKIDEIQKQINKFKDKFKREIANLSSSYREQGEGTLSEEDADFLGLTDVFFSEKVKDEVLKCYKDVFGSILPVIKQSDHKIETFECRSNSFVHKYVDWFSERCIDLLEIKRKSLIQEICNFLDSDESVSDDVKKMLKQIDVPDIPHFDIKFKDIRWCNGIIQNLLKKLKLAVAKEFKEAIEERCGKIKDKITINLKKLYADIVNNICDDVQKKYSERIEDLSSLIQEQMDNKEKLEEFSNFLNNYLDSLKKSSDELNLNILNYAG